MAKGVCLIQSNNTKSYTINSFIYYYLFQLGSGLPGYVNFLSPPVPGGMRGAGVQGSAACDQNFVRDSITCVMAFRGVSLGP